MTAPDFSTDIGKLRALIPDTEPIFNPADPFGGDAYIFPDTHLQALLDINGGNIKRAAADACATLGTSEALIAKVIKTEDLQTDGAKIMGQFLARAKQLRDQADQDEANEDPAFEIVPYVPYPPLVWPW